MHLIVVIYMDSWYFGTVAGFPQLNQLVTQTGCGFSTFSNANYDVKLLTFC